jgi:hypothetical protein
VRSDAIASVDTPPTGPGPARRAPRRREKAVYGFSG